ncbi:ankyrin repeat protein [Bacillus sp. SLBN-46]|uniref:ankyrin repeat domain-containing protein n=1 Tax=Bacillus sp. SLBN-46 TaxID=3042283 RepID=UPI00285A8EFE|nr:ankyrin repeat domain-containing protein [Bacillus sp. SLBN-46]MDR6121188.1 ankyrin repeat protein [Bacillus sp. SLBN-46]
MENRNFSFIPKDWEVIEYLAKTAENNIYQDPNTAIVKLRMLGETLTKAIFALEGLTLLKGQYKCLVLLKEKEIITNEIYEKLELIRKEGNTAVHTAGYGDKKSALQLSRYSFDLIVWFLSTYVESSVTSPDYVPPMEQQISNSAPIIYEELEQAFKEKLIELDKELQRVKKNNSIVLNPNAQANEETSPRVAPGHAQERTRSANWQMLRDKHSNRQKQGIFKMKIGAIAIAAMIVLFLLLNGTVAFATGKFMLSPIDHYFLHSTMEYKGESFQEYSFKKAIDKEDTKRIESLITLGVDPNIKSGEGKLAINLSIQKNNRDLFRSLITNGADPFLKDRKGNSSLDVAVEKQDLYFIKALLKDKNVSDLTAKTLKKLSESNNSQLLRLFMESGMNPNLQLPEGETFLIHAIEQNNMEAVKMLLDHGADPNLQSEGGKYPLHTSIQKKNVSMAKLLLESGASPNQIDTNKKYPIELAHEANMLDFESVLLQFKSRSLFEIMLPSYIGYWKEKKESPEQILEINKDNTGSWYMALYSGDSEKVVQMVPGTNTFTPVNDKEIKVLNSDFTKVSEEEFQAEKKRLSSKQAVSSQTQQLTMTSTSNTNSSSITKNTETPSTSQKPSEPSLLSKKVDSLIGVWKRVPPLNNTTHDVRYIYVVKNNYGSVPSWRIYFESKWTQGAGENNVKEGDLELVGNSIATLKRPAPPTYTSKGFYKTNAVRGFIIKINSANSINVQHLDHNDSQILNEEFRKISKNEMEPEYLDIYNAASGN